MSKEQKSENQKRSENLTIYMGSCFIGVCSIFCVHVLYIQTELWFQLKLGRSYMAIPIQNVVAGCSQFLCSPTSSASFFIVEARSTDYTIQSGEWTVLTAGSCGFCGSCSPCGACINHILRVFIVHPYYKSLQQAV